MASQNPTVPDSTGGTQKKTPLYTIWSADDFRAHADEFPYSKELLRNVSRTIRYCKAEVFRDCVIGTIRIPQKKEEKEPLLTFNYYLTGEHIVFVGNSGKLKPIVAKCAAALPESTTPDQLLLAILKQTTEDDLLYLLHIESQTDKMEEEIANSKAEDFFKVLTVRRHKLSELNAYYEQLRDIGELLQSAACGAIVQHGQEWDRFVHRAERLQNHVQFLRENIIQLRELFQSVQDARQNRTMGIITIVTTVFFPLTLLTGWYGMNFVNMPELNWRYGYAAMIIVVLVIVTVEIIYFKKKKFF